MIGISVFSLCTAQVSLIDRFVCHDSIVGYSECYRFYSGGFFQYDYYIENYHWISQGYFRQIDDTLILNSFLEADSLVVFSKKSLARETGDSINLSFVDVFGNPLNLHYSACLPQKDDDDYSLYGNTVIIPKTQFQLFVRNTDSSGLPNNNSLSTITIDTTNQSDCIISILGMMGTHSFLPITDKKLFLVNEKLYDETKRRVYITMVSGADKVDSSSIQMPYNSQ